MWRSNSTAKLARSRPHAVGRLLCSSVAFCRKPLHPVAPRKVNPEFRRFFNGTPFRSGVRFGSTVSFSRFFPETSPSRVERFCSNSTRTLLDFWLALIHRRPASAMQRPDRIARARDRISAARRSKIERTMQERDLYSIDEARERLGGISRNSIYQILRTGQLASVVIGSRRFVSAAAIAQLITKSTTTESPTEAAARAPIRSKRKRDLAASPLLIHPKRSDVHR